MANFQTGTILWTLVSNQFISIMDSKHSDTRWATENDRWCNGGERGEVYSKEKSDYEGAAWVSKYVCWLEGTIK